MAQRQYSVSSGVYTLTSAATKSAWLLNPSTASMSIFEIGISLDNVTTNAEPVRCQFYRVTTIGTPAGTSGTISALDEAHEASSNTALVQLSTEPTTVTVMWEWFVQPNSGLFVVQYPLGREPKTKAAGARMGLRFVTASGVTPQAISYVIWEE